MYMNDRLVGFFPGHLFSPAWGYGVAGFQPASLVMSATVVRPHTPVWLDPKGCNGLPAVIEDQIVSRSPKRERCNESDI